MLAAVKGASLGLRYFSSNCSKGYRQAHLVILPKHLADDFEAFCHSNPAPLPLLERRQWGEHSCPPLAKDDVIRIYQGGVLLENVSSLQNSSVSARSASQQSSGLEVKWSDMVCFYLGCSFGLEAGLKKALAVVRKASMYKTAVPCIQAGVFSCPLVVSMCPIPPSRLQAAVQVTHQNPHGAPVHIGDADLLGIQDLSRPDYGGPVELQPADVPVFWACGVTAVEAIISSKPSLAFTHSAGSSVGLPGVQGSSPMGPPPHSMGLASQRAVSKVRKLEAIIGEDPGQRGIKALFIQDELIRSCLALSHASSVAITTGFPTHYMHSPPDETDGPPGAVAMATMLLSLGKKVTLVVDRRALEMNQAIMAEAVKKANSINSLRSINKLCVQDMEAELQHQPHRISQGLRLNAATHFHSLSLAHCGLSHTSTSNPASAAPKVARRAHANMKARPSEVGSFGYKKAWPSPLSTVPPDFVGLLGDHLSHQTTVNG
ncbi:D-glutamate cyclase, mitochondrial-like [Nerophis ophidion]|uniref:D-glutamate cyclase, mitochondrial-like n=1 Tax=Nerophis ophidion TaxID=159077 RepID=UPI002AE0302D|nr:D-glutamate cyclase, mitochondrial-like [Nerophis ophidion]